MTETLDEIVRRMGEVLEPQAWKAKGEMRDSVAYESRRTSSLRKAVASLTALARTHALVPREASEGVLRAGRRAQDEGARLNYGAKVAVEGAWDAMLSASDLFASLREGG